MPPEDDNNTIRKYIHLSCIATVELTAGTGQGWRTDAPRDPFNHVLSKYMQKRNGVNPRFDNHTVISNSFETLISERNQQQQTQTPLLGIETPPSASTEMSSELSNKVEHRNGNEHRAMESLCERMA